ncbi:MAG: hypothetical protein V4632_10075 [Pseudomonadota bacterium]
MAGLDGVLIAGNSIGLSLSPTVAALTNPSRNNPSQSAQGRNGELVFVNLSNGNLVLQDGDSVLVGAGPDTLVTRTYNSQGRFDDDNGDNWRIGLYQSAVLRGMANQAGSSIVRTGGDGASATYQFDAAGQRYISSAGSGPRDQFTIDGSGRLLWTNGDDGLLETYEAGSAGRLLSSADRSGNRLDYSYGANGLLSKVVNQRSDGQGEATFLDYLQNQLVQIRTVVSNAGVTSSQTRVRYQYDGANRLSTAIIDLTPADGDISDASIYETRYAYDGTSKRIARITQSDGTSLSVTYVQTGPGADYRVASVTDGLGHTTSYTYDLPNRRSTVADPLGKTTTYAYDSAGQLTRITGPAIDGFAETTQFVYNTQGDVTRIIDAAGNSIDLEYDAQGNQILQSDSAGNRLTRRYDAGNQLIAESISNGSGAKATTFYVQDAGQRYLLRFVISPEGRVTEYRYNSLGQRTSSIRYVDSLYPLATLAAGAMPEEAGMARWVAESANRARSQRSDMDYDFRGQLSRLTEYAFVDAGGNGVADGSQGITQYVHDASGQLLKTIAQDAVQLFVYDGLGRLVAGTDAFGAITTTRYDDASNKTTVTLANGLTRTRSYDRAGRLIGVSDAGGAAVNLGQTRYVYDAGNRLHMTQDATGVRNWILYDERGRKIAEIDGDGSLIETRYTPGGQVSRTIAWAGAVDLSLLVDANGQPAYPALAALRPAASALDRSTRFAYDASGRLVQTVDANGAVTETSYDSASRVQAVTRRSNRADTAALAAASVTVAASAGDRVTRNFHDRDGLLRATLDGAGALIEYRYDSAAQLIQRIAYATPVGDTLRATATLEQLLAAPVASADDARTTWLRNSRGLVAGEIDAEGFLTENVYDNRGQLSRQVRYAIRVSVPVDPASTIAGMRPAASAGDRGSSWRYDAMQRVIEETDAEGTVTQNRYDLSGRLVTTSRAAGTAEVRSLAARYDLQGRLTGELTAEGARLLSGDLNQTQIDNVWNQHALTHRYDLAGRRMSTTDQLGNRTLYYHDADGRLTHTINALGEVSEEQYNTLGQQSGSVLYGQRIAQAVLAGLNGGLADAALGIVLNAIRNSDADIRISHGYDLGGRLEHSVDAMGHMIRYVNNTFGERVSRSETIDAGGSTSTVTQNTSYDRRGLVLATSEGGAVRSMQYDSFGRLIRSVDANGNVRSQQYDRLGRVVQTTDPTDARRFTSWDAFGRVLTQTDALGNVTRTEYNSATRSTTVTTPEGITVTTIRNRHGETQSVRDGRGNVTQFSYDANGALLGTTAAGNAMSRRYDRAGQLIETIDANGNVVVLSYDAARRVLARTVAPGSLNLTTRYQYDAQGRQTGVTDANGTLTQMVYDRNSRLTRQIVDPGGLALTTIWTYDQRGQMISVTDPNGGLTQYLYDRLGRRTEERVDPKGLNLTTRHAYDGNGNVITRTDANGNVTRFAHDTNNRLVFTLDALGTLRHIVYDAEGRTIKTVAYARPLDTAAMGGDFTLDRIRQALASSAGDVIEHRVLDRDGRITATVNALGEVVGFSYDAGGNVIERTGHANRIVLADWIVGTTPRPVADPAHDQRQRTVYDALGRAVYTIDGAGAVVAQAYDRNGNLIERIACASAIDPGTAATAPALSAAILAVADPSRDLRQHHEYDAANRLIRSLDGAGAVTELRYDGNGNLTRQIRYATAVAANAQASTVVASSADRITVMQYDAANRQVLIIDAAGGVTRSEYDRNGNLIRRVAYAKAASAPTAVSDPVNMESLASLLADASRDRVQRVAYDAANHAIITVDALGAVTENQYDAAGNLTQITRRAIALDATDGMPAASASALRAGIRADDANDRITRSVFDAANRAVYRIDPLGYVSKSDYDTFGRVTARTEYSQALSSVSASTAAAIAGALAASPQRVTANTWDAAGRLISSTDALQFRETHAYNALGARISFTNKNGAVWQYDYDTSGRLTQETSPQVELTSVITNAAGSLNIDRSRSGSFALVTRFDYDALGNLLARHEAVGRPEARTTRYVYDALGRQIKTIHPAVGIYNAAADNLLTNGATGLAARTESLQVLYSQVSYDTLGNAVSNRDIAGLMSYKVHDRLGQVTEDIDALGFVNAMVRNSFGEVIAMTRHASALAPGVLADPNLSSATIRAALNAAGAERRADRILLTEYDRAGREILRTEPQALLLDPDGPASGQSFTAGRTTHTLYNAFGDVIQLAQLKNPLTRAWTVSTSYVDQRGQQILQVDALGHAIAQSFDGAGNVLTRTAFATAIASWKGTRTSSSASTFASADAPPPAPVAVAAKADRSTLYAYDANNRLLSETQRDVAIGSASSAIAGAVNLVTRHAYDALGNQTTLTNAAGASAYTWYDVLGRIAAQADVQRLSVERTELSTPLTEFRRDAYGNMVVKTERALGATGAVAATAAPIAAANAADRITLMRYDSLDRATQSTDARGIGHFNSYDAQGRIAKEWQLVTDVNGAKRSVFRVLQFDALGRNTAIISEAVSVYDAATGSSREVNPTERRRYDAHGNLVQRTDANGHSTWTWYDSGNRKLAEVNAVGMLSTWAYDSRGNAVLQRIHGEAVPLPAGANAAMPVLPGTDNLRETRFRYDALDQLVETRTAAAMTGRYSQAVSSYGIRMGAIVTTNEYNNFGQVARFTDGNGGQSTTFFNTLGQTILSIDAEGYGVARQYDAQGRVVRETCYAQRYGNPYSADSDALTILAAWPAGPDDRITTTVYDQGGNSVQESRLNVDYASIEGAGALTQRNASAVTGKRVNFAGEVVQQTDANGNVVNFRRDASGNQLSQTNAYFTDANARSVRVVTERVYDELNQVTRNIERGLDGSTDSDDLIMTSLYGAGRRLLQTTDALGQITRYGYDAAGNLSAILHGRSDADGTLHGEETRIEYDARDREVRRWTVSDGVRGTVDEIRYNVHGEVTGQRSHGGTVAPADWQRIARYDTLGRAWLATDERGQDIIYLYDANGNATLKLESQTLDLRMLTLTDILGQPNVMQTFTVYDQRNQVVNIIQPAMSASRPVANLQAFALDVGQLGSHTAQLAIGGSVWAASGGGRRAGADARGGQSRDQRHAGCIKYLHVDATAHGQQIHQLVLDHLFLQFSGLRTDLRQLQRQGRF